MTYQDRQEAMAQTIRPMLTINIKKILVELDAQIISARADVKNDDFSEVQNLNFVRTVCFDVLDERNESAWVDAYLDNRFAKVGA